MGGAVSESSEDNNNTHKWKYKGMPTIHGRSQFQRVLKITITHINGNIRGCPPYMGGRSFRDY